MNNLAEFNEIWILASLNQMNMSRLLQNTYTALKWCTTNNQWANIVKMADIKLLSDDKTVHARTSSVISK